ncbi:hypothetical protein GBA63_15640 [Rubrobacter tropicus]|uniref:Thiamine-binding protein domain-containing protein n=1 Tax=Rubrobacter tropicus TaxID=2653851 RepID=A0A6G8QBP3_9ACTN|nr:hypothetical protein [Rubrobacter tropicus]QIN83915.1 hypothetical protein GBA63_15640 [Rubrobacter tropicus]
MPGYERAELTAELKVLPSGEDEARAQIEAARTAAGETGLAREAGPETMILAGGRKEVLAAATRVVEAALDAGARGAEVVVEAEAEAGRFDQA